MQGTMNWVNVSYEAITMPPLLCVLLMQLARWCNFTLRRDAFADWSALYWTGRVTSYADATYN